MIKRKQNLGIGMTAYNKGNSLLTEYNLKHNLYGVEGFEHCGYTVSYANAGDMYADTLVMISDTDMLSISSGAHSIWEGSYGDAIEFIDELVASEPEEE